MARRHDEGKLIAELTEKLTVPGYVPGFLQPIENRILMISTGIRAQVGIKILGEDLEPGSRMALKSRTSAQNPRSRSAWQPRGYKGSQWRSLIVSRGPLWAATRSRTNRRGRGRHRRKKRQHDNRRARKIPDSASARAR